MKKLLKEFFGNKFNIVLTVIQVLALIMLVLGKVSGFCYLLAIAMEGVFFIVWGIRIFCQNKEIVKKQNIIDSLPISQNELDTMHKSNTRHIKANKLQAVLFIMMGIVLIFMLIF